MLRLKHSRTCHHSECEPWKLKFKRGRLTFEKNVKGSVGVVAVFWERNVSAIYSDIETFPCYSLKLSAIFKNQFLKWSPAMNVFFSHSLLALSVQSSCVPSCSFKASHRKGTLSPKVAALAISSWLPAPEVFYSCYLQYKEQVSSYPHSSE